MSLVIPKNTPIPCSKFQYYVTGDDNQTIIEIPTYQGESEYSHENKQIDHFTMNIDPRPAFEVERFIVTFDYDANNILKVTATENVQGGKSESRNINCNNAQMTVDDIAVAQARARLFGDEE